MSKTKTLFAYTASQIKDDNFNKAVDDCFLISGKVADRIDLLLKRAMDKLVNDNDPNQIVYLRGKVQKKRFNDAKQIDAFVASHIGWKYSAEKGSYSKQKDFVGTRSVPKVRWYDHAVQAKPVKPIDLLNALRRQLENCAGDKGAERGFVQSETTVAMATKQLSDLITKMEKAEAAGRVETATAAKA